MSARHVSDVPDDGPRDAWGRSAWRTAAAAGLDDTMPPAVVEQRVVDVVADAYAFATDSDLPWPAVVQRAERQAEDELQAERELPPFAARRIRRPHGAHK